MKFIDYMIKYKILIIYLKVVKLNKLNIQKFKNLFWLQKLSYYPIVKRLKTKHNMVYSTVCILLLLVIINEPICRYGNVFWSKYDWIV